MTIVSMSSHTDGQGLDHSQQRRDLAASFQLAARLDLHEGVANHFSLAVDGPGRKFLMNPNQKHFARIRPEDLLLLDAEDKSVLSRPDAPDATAWGLHGSIHRLCPHARCLMHVHSRYATALACLADSRLPPIDQNTAMFFNRVVIDEDFSGLAFESEGERCALLLADPARKVMIMGNHGLLVLGQTVGETFDRLYYFERAARTYIDALQTGKPLRVLDDRIAEKVAVQIENYNGDKDRHFNELKAILDDGGEVF